MTDPYNQDPPDTLLWKILKNWPVLLVGILFGPALIAVLIVATKTVLTAWTAQWRQPDVIFFDGDDIKLFFVYGISILCGFAYLLLGNARLFGSRAEERRATVTMGMALFGVMTFVTLTSEDRYLARAQSYGQQHGYSTCDADRLRYFKELKMARTPEDCDRESPVSAMMSKGLDYMFRTGEGQDTGNDQ